MIQHKETRRRYVFAAPHSLEGPDVVEVPFPAAARRYPDEDGVIVHDCNPAMVQVNADTPTELTALPENIQPCSMLVVNNEKDEDVIVSGVVCPSGVRTILMFDGWGYQRINISDKIIVGKSAYDLWIEVGNEGTIAEYLDSLKGDKGNKGEPGEKGERGNAFAYADFTPEQLALLKSDKDDSINKTASKK